MYIQCPHCKQQIDITESGKVACSLCHKLFEAFLFIPSQRETVIRPEAALSSEEFKEARCYLHAENKAHHICERCGSFICEICLTEIETKKLCPRCFDRLENDGALQTTKTSYFNWGSLILSLSLLSFFCYGFFTAPFIIGLAVYALFQIKKDPEKRGKASVITGIIFSILSMIFWISIFFIPLIIRMAKH